MRVTEELNQSRRNALKTRHRDHHLFQTHFAAVLNQPHCLKIELFANDYSRILIHSCLPIGTGSRYQLLSEAVAYIKVNQHFLDTTASGCLNGQQVKHYLTELSRCRSDLPECFAKMGDCFMLDKDSSSDTMHNEITDGMHRLVAYGLVTNMEESLYPISIYFGTNKPPRIVEAV